MKSDFDEKELESLIRRWQENDDLEARSQLIDLMYGWLKRQASILLTKRHGQSRDDMNRPMITTTELTHNILLKLMQMQNRLKWQGRGRFLSFVLTVMRNYLMDLAKSSYHRTKSELDEQALAMSDATPALVEFDTGGQKTLLSASDVEKMTAITEVFRNYEQMDPLRGQIIQLNVLCGTAAAEIALFFADETPMTVAEVEGHLRVAKVYLRRELTKNGIKTF
jgi:DNA-directed RNA polymerase specialized sigma24 family protein